MSAPQNPALTAPGGGLPVAPSLEPALRTVELPPETGLISGRTLWISALAALLGVAAAYLARALTMLIALVTNLSFHGTWSIEEGSPLGHHWGAWVILIPTAGGLVVGIMARYGSAAIRGHGIPEAMENVLVGQSRVPARLAVLKPLSAAISIGTGGPFGAEGPIIASGGSLGSLLGQMLPITPLERRALLAGGAAAGMTAIFGSPVAAALLAIELLLFEYRPRTIVPVVVSTAIAAAMRLRFGAPEPFFAMDALAHVGGGAVLACLALGILFGLAAWGATRAVYRMEELFERLPLNWMFWPALGGLVVGVIGYWFPRTMGVGYENITDVINDRLALRAVALLCLFKFISWVVALSSGTSGGTLAPLFTIGGGLGALLGHLVQHYVPSAGLDPRLAALVGMAAVFAGSTRALLTSVVFVLETTHRPEALAPLLAGCGAAYLVSCHLLPRTLMTEKIARRKIIVPEGYTVSPLEHIAVGAVMSREVVSVPGDRPLEDVRRWIMERSPAAQHQGFPVVDAGQRLTGVVTHRDILEAPVDGRPLTVSQLVRRPPVVVYDDCSVGEAVNHMARHGVGRLPVMSRVDPARMVGILSRSDVLRVLERAAREREVAPQERGAKAPASARAG